MPTFMHTWADESVTIVQEPNLAAALKVFKKIGSVDKTNVQELHTSFCITIMKTKDEEGEEVWGADLDDHTDALLEDALLGVAEEEDEEESEEEEDDDWEEEDEEEDDDDE
jgi:hypothetical protein